MKVWQRLLTGSDTTLLAEVLDFLRATGNIALGQLPRMEAVLTASQRALCSCSRIVTGVELTLHDMGIMLLARVSDGRCSQASGRDSDEFGQLNHDEEKD